MGMLNIGKNWGVFHDEKKWNGAKHRQNPRGKPASVCLHQTLREEFPFQQDNNLQHKAKSTLELTKTVNVPEWPSYNFDLNLLEILRQDLNITV